MSPSAWQASFGQQVQGFASLRECCGRMGGVALPEVVDTVEFRVPKKNKSHRDGAGRGGDGQAIM